MWFRESTHARCKRQGRFATKRSSPVLDKFKDTTVDNYLLTVQDVHVAT